jgi:hypothetical protein
MSISEINYEMVYSNSNDLEKGICQIPSQNKSLKYKLKKIKKKIQQ